METTVTSKPRVTQCQKPSGFIGQFVLRNMNSRHSKVTDWGLAHVTIEKDFTILDVGCGGGRTVNKLARLATEGKVYGIDFSSASVAFATKLNKDTIAAGRLEIREASVSQMPFPTGTFDLVTAVETHFWWPDLRTDSCEVHRVLKPGGRLAIIAEVYKGANTTTARLAEKYLPMTGMKMLTADEHRNLLTQAGFTDVIVDVDPDKGWIFAAGKKSFQV